MIRTMLKFIFIFYFFTGAAFSEEVIFYSWKTCVELTKKNNLELKNSLLRLEQSLSQEKIYRSTFLPKVNAGLGYTNNDSSLYSASINVSQDLFSGFSDYKQIKKAKINTEISTINYQIKKAEVSYDLKTTYEGLLYANEYKALMDEILKRRIENLKMVELRFESGRENKGVALLSKAYLEQAKYEQIQAVNLKQKTKEYLSKILKIDIKINFDVKDLVPSILNNYISGDKLEDAVKSFPEYKKIVLDEKFSEINIDSQKAGFFPSLNFSASLSRSDEQFFPKGNNWGAGLSLIIPLFNGGYDYYSMQNATLIYDESQINTIKIFDTLYVTYSNLINLHKENLQKLKSDALFLEASTVRAKIARSKYENGLLDFEEWDRIENELIQRQKEYLKTKKDCVTSEANIEKISGVGVIND